MTAGGYLFCSTEFSGHVTMGFHVENSISVSRAGLPVRRHGQDLAEASRRRGRSSKQADAALGFSDFAAVLRGTGGRAEADREHAAGAVDGRRWQLTGCLEERVCGRTTWPATAWASIRRWSPPARSISPTRCDWSASAGRYMQEAVPPGVGAMAAIFKLPQDKLEAVLAEAAQGEVVTAANFNSPDQIVIAGHAARSQRAGELAKAAGAKRAVPLPVSAPFHCPLMKPAQDRMRAELDAVSFSDLRFR